MEDLVRSHKDRLEFIELSVLRKAGGENLDLLSYLVQGRRMVAFVGLLCH